MSDTRGAGCSGVRVGVRGFLYGCASDGIRDHYTLRSPEPVIEGSVETIIRVEYGPYLASLKPEDTAAIVVSSIIEQMTIASRSRTEQAAPSHDGVSLGRVARAIGQRLATESTGDKRAKFKRDAQITSSVKDYRKKMVAQLRKTEVVEKPWESSTGVPQQLEQFHWPSTIRLQLGAALVAKVLDTAKINVKKDEGESSKPHKEPAFGHKKIVVKGKHTGILSPNAHLRDLLAREAGIQS